MDLKNLYQKASTKVEFTNDGKAINNKKGKKIKRLPTKINEVSSSEEEDFKSDSD